MHPSYNEYVLQTCIGSGWITPEQEEECRIMMRGEADMIALDYLYAQGYLSEQYKIALEQAIQRAIAEAGPQAGSSKPQAQAEAPSQAGSEAAPTPAAVSRAPAVDNEVGQSIAAEISGGSIHLHPDGAFRHVNDYLTVGQKYQVSDIHIGVAAPPLMRRFGLLQPMYPNAQNLTPAQTERLLFGILTEEQKTRFKEIGHVDYAYEVEGLGRFRTVIVRQRRGIDGVFRVINTRVPTMEEIGLDPQLKRLTEYNNGLVLVTGAVGTGKSTTLAALIEEVNRTRRDHIITLEDPVEYVFAAKGCQVTQREIHTHTQSFSNALRAALREDPDVIMVGEMRDLETIQLAITASETGHLVFGTLHTSNASRTLDRILDAFPVDQQEQIKTMVSESLRGIISQQLVPRLDGKGRALAMEILINNPAAANLIRESKTFMLPSVIQTGKKLGMRLMDESLMDLLDKGVIPAEEAHLRAENKEIFKEYLED